MYEKFKVHRTDGNGADAGDRHYGCRYFVLDLDHDDHAPAALRAYAESCWSQRPQLGRDIAEMLDARSLGDVLEEKMRHDAEAGEGADQRPLRLTWGENAGRSGHGHVFVEWHAPCGCAYHPEGEQGPHVHQCAEHGAGGRREDEGDDQTREFLRREDEDESNCGPVSGALTNRKCPRCCNRTVYATHYPRSIQLSCQCGHKWSQK